jgi:hypothetical protein
LKESHEQRHSAGAPSPLAKLRRLHRLLFPSFTRNGIPRALLRLRRNRTRSIACAYGENRLHARRHLGSASFA